MQSDVTLVGGNTPPAQLITPPSPQRMAEQASVKPPAALGVPKPLPRPADVSQTAAVTEAKVALSVEAAPTALSQAERVLKPYGVTMLPEPPTDVAQETEAQETTTSDS